MLPDDLKKLLLASMNATFTNSSFQQFTATRKELFGIDYESVSTGTTPLDKGLAAYLQRMEESRRTCYFVKEYYDAYPANQLVSQMFDSFRQMFAFNEAEPFRIRSEFLDCLMINEESLPFVGRENVKEAVYKLLNGRKSRITLLEGESRSGLSYTRWYLMEVAKKTNAFEVVYVDFKKVFMEYDKSVGLVYAADIANFINDYLNIGFSFDPDKKETFKITPFLGKLKEYVEKTKRTYLFFFDQFDVLTYTDVTNFVQGIADLSLGLNPDFCYIVLSGCKDTGAWQSDLSRIINQKQNKLSIEPFDKVNLELFFRKIYIYLSAFHEVDTTWEGFKSQVFEPMATPDLFKTPNAEKVGNAVWSWYERFCEENAIA